MRTSPKKILKVLTYGFFVTATFLVGLVSGNNRGHGTSSEFSLSTAPTAYADVPPVGSDTGSAGCAGSGDGADGADGADGDGDGSEGSK